jgi:tRNA threonylcarbamoyladenosine biosynthesis protein TsaB
VGIGPGSYTGIRVGVMTAKAMSYAAKVPLVGVCTLQCFVPSQNGEFAVLIDAKIGGAYVITGSKKGKTISYDIEPRVCELDKVGNLLKPMIVTPNGKMLQTKLERLYSGAQWEWEERSPDAMHMNEMAQDKFKKGEIAVNGHLDLMYLRKTQAEIEKQKRAGS